MKIIIKKIKPEDIDFLQKNDTLYSSDFRSISEDMNYKIPAMWKYENLMGWIIKNKSVIVNSDYEKLRYPFGNNFIKINKSKDPRVSIYKKITNITKDIKKLWVAIPHPDADIFARDNNLKINYAYSDFLLKNDKIKQKELLGNITPRWEKIKDINNFKRFKDKRNGYIKRKFGSGGFTVFNVKEIKENTQFENLINNDGEWYFEEFAKGKSCSVQCLIDENSDVTIFGFSEQIIANKKNFVGSKILDLNDLNKKSLDALKIGIKKIYPLLKNYNGFFGVDFIINNTNISILEANIRMTAATIPTLISNMCACDNAIYYEDVEKYENNDIVLAFNDKDIDKIQLMPLKSNLGKYVYIDIKNSKKIFPKIDNEHLTYLSKIISKNVSPIVKTDFYNFWPYGWTLSFILKDSHCVMSSWFLEKTTQIDIFSCNKDFSENKLAGILNKYFDGIINKIKVEIR
ncbi:MAG: ATP-grasp domain-containing protein [Candidatus Paceibacterota bacterium]|jgi:S-adenosylmethionine/arginine decarboxylase-like enzyme